MLLVGDSPFDLPADVLDHIAKFVARHRGALRMVAGIKDWVLEVLNRLHYDTWVSYGTTTDHVVRTVVGTK